MLKTQAIELLGGSVATAAKAIGITYQAVGKWPEVLTPALRDRVQAALYRRSLDLTNSNAADLAGVTRPVSKADSPATQEN